MSVSPGKASLPPHRIPRKFTHVYPGATGNNSYVCWRTGEGPFVDCPFAPKLLMRVDTELDNHGLVEPDSEMEVSDYRQALADTQAHWAKEAWAEGAVA